jgi:glutathionyl-hydroquinone reductase
LPGVREQGWLFGSDSHFPECTPGTVNAFRHLHQAYTATDPHYAGKVTVPTLWDTKTRRIVNNESSEIIRMLNSEFRGIAGDDTHFYPMPLRTEIDRINELVYANVNNGVYDAVSHVLRLLTKQLMMPSSRRSTSLKSGYRATAI